MFGILMSAGNALLAFTLRAIVMKFVIFTVLFAVVSAFINYIVKGNILPIMTNAQNLAGSLSSGVSYMFTIFNIWTGMSMIISAYITRFMIRRIPVIG